MTAGASVRPFSLALDEPLATASGRIEARSGFLFLARDGVGEATPLPGWTEARADCRRALDGARDALDERGFDAAVAAAADAGAPAARHGVALARDDDASRRAGVPLYRHLGGGERVERVPANATVGDGDPGETADRAADAADVGFDCVKVKAGARDPAADVERLRAVRDAVGPGVALRVDANGAWDRPTARRVLGRLAALDVSYVEQPLPADDLDGLAALRGGEVGVAVDETLASEGVEAVLEAGAADVVVLKPMVLGGVDRARAAALRARDAGLTPVVTTTVDAVYARTAAVHLAASLGDVPPCGLATAAALAGDLAPDPAPVEAGAASVPQSKGTGVGPPEGE